ncbi:Polymorphic membrane protein F,chlamydial polymorphic outer membrane protein repeat,Autotransporter beta-domain [Chlamydia serpentis]|uniref:Polymorphic membrane protein F,chlamydial polymorphic outer membrane protein repeat,Autotransporter beta-domain n=1 Tax=Chlamydia serpentis TaxID=1967782 RepID=A0A2R8FCC0_9CHLA|nr:autotransporter domain-containing protein [Chlamydia serpentis]SPN74070.1 Polymorphic membrane protein F,chlamydial polymorphic outer membrane protein repeat,Autotransporter beta-domain [Chlamydia serpentis]
MVAKKTARSYRSTFSHSVIVAIFSAGISFQGVFLNGSELDLGVLSEQFIKSSSNINVENEITSVVNESDTVNSIQKDSDKSNYNVVSLTQGSNGKTLDTSQPNFLDNFQHLVQETTLYTIDQKLIWSDLDTRNSLQLSPQLDPVNLKKTEDVADPKEDKLNQENKNTSQNLALETSSSDIIEAKISSQDPFQGLAFCYKNTLSKPISETVGAFQGIIFSGSGDSAGLGFENIKAPDRGAAIYSDADVVFKNFAKGLDFKSCESLKDGSVSGANIVVTDCGNVVLTDCKTSLNLEALSLTKDFSRGGAVFHADSNDAMENALLGGQISILHNKGAFLVSENSSEKANGGAFACESFICRGNENTVLWKGNRALSGGAISSKGDIQIEGNSSLVEFSENQSLVSLGEDVKTIDFVGGGALATQGIVTLRNNAIVQYTKNTSKTHGGAILADVVNLNETIGGVSFKNNTAVLTGGALTANNKVLIQNNFGDLIFEENEVRNRGGAIYCGPQSIPTLKENTSIENISIIGNSGSITFLKNKASILEVMTQEENYAGGGALWGHNISLDSNSGNIEFSGNLGGSTFSIGKYVGGGAILSTSVVTISKNSGNLVFKSNKGQGLSEKYIAPQVTETSPGNTQPIVTEDVSYQACVRKDRACYDKKVAADQELPEPIKVEGETLTKEESVVLLSEKAEEQPTISSIDIRGGGAILAEQILITDNSGNLRFSHNLGGGEESSAVGDTAIVGGGALLSTNEVVVRNNQAITFSDNVTSNGYDSGGAILAKSIEISENYAVEFCSNGSGNFGGAICALKESVNVIGNNSLVSFEKNRTRIGGAGIAAPKGSVTISNNQGNIEFKDNIVFGSQENSQSSGGAILAKTFVNIQDNQGDVLFLGNSTGSYGGAIFVGSLVPSERNDKSTLTILGNTGNILFAKNNTQIAPSSSVTELSGGGAVYTQNLKIAQNKGTVSFYGNRASSGAGIQIAEGGTVVLEAFGGDIAFEGNINFDGSCNAIHLCGKDSKIVELSAVAGKSIIFGDPITYEDYLIRSLPNEGVSPLSAPSLIFNRKSQDEIQEHHEGTIRFSHGTSKIPQIAVIQQGTLALSQNAELWLAGLKQEAGSTILLSAGSVLRIFESEIGTKTPPTSIENKPEKSISAGIQIGMSTPLVDKVIDTTTVLADITNVVVDISSFIPEQDGTLPLPPEIVIPKGTTLNSNKIDLKIVDLTNIGYENHILLSSPKDIPLIALKTAEGMSGTPITDSSLSNVEIDVSLPELTTATYGHTGIWSETKMDDGKLVVGWQPTGYKLNPEKQGALILNSLWSQYTDLGALKQEIFGHHTIAQRMELDFSTNIWGSGLGVIEDCRNISDIDGFKHQLAGYCLGLDTQLVEDFLIGGCFTQFFGKTDSQSYTAKIHQKSYVGAAYSGILAGSWLVKGAFVYGNVNNELTTDYTNLGNSTGSWIGKGFIASSSIDYRYIVNRRRLLSSIISTVVPFVEVEYARIDLPEFCEQGKEVRIFKKTRFENVGIPVGFALEHGYSRGSRSEVNSVQVSYVFDICRKQPVSLVTLKDAAYSWKSQGVDIPCKAWKSRFSNNTEWNSYLSTYLGFNYEWREDLTAYDFNGGIRIIF